jgi:energy-coupling factor transporter ATP-binding protein EcfA2
MAKSNKKITSHTKDQSGVKSKNIPVYFLSLTVSDIKCFTKQQTLKLADDHDIPFRWTILLGDNGVGKTTLLQCLASLELAEDKFKGDVFLFPKGFSTQSKVGFAKLERKYSIATDLSIGSGLNEKKSGAHANLHYYREVSGNGGATITGVDQLQTDYRILICYGYGAARRMGDPTFKTVEGYETSLSLFDDDTPLINAEEWLLQLNYAAISEESKDKGVFIKRREHVNSLLINLLPEVESIRFAEITKENPNPGVEVKTPYGWVGMSKLSLGYRTLITWMVDLAARLFERYPDSDDPLSEPAIVLIDEIDLHLHPKWQRTLMSYLSERFKNTQFIATAHSPLIIQSAGDANIVLVRREGDHSVIHNDIATVKGWRVDQILTSDLFGLSTSRPPEYEDIINKRRSILSKPELDSHDMEELKKLEKKFYEMPTADTLEDIEAMDIIREAASLIKK